MITLIQMPCFDRLEKILKALLSTLNGTEVLDSVPSVIPQIEKIIRSMVKSMQAQNGKRTTKQLLS